MIFTDYFISFLLYFFSHPAFIISFFTLLFALPIWLLVNR